MKNGHHRDFIDVVKMTQTLLSSHGKNIPTPKEIYEILERVLELHPAWSQSVDKDEVAVELIRRSRRWSGTSSTMSSSEGHIDWLEADRKTGWRYWQRYRELLEESLPGTSIDEVEKSTDEILKLLEDPLRKGSWDRRGLVVGHVQSGKTANYTGLICKAADSGYKIIIVLAGMHNNLRSQTQIRLDEGFLGFETHPDPDEIKLTGVGYIDSDPSIRPNFATNRSEKGDFTANNSKDGISPEERPWLFVVKKNKTILERLLRWINNHVADAVDEKTGIKLVSQLPLLVIDDEADNASVDTAELEFDDLGRPDEEHNPKTINRLIRSILYSFSKSAYVGYTATPFANIFIHNKGKTKTHGPDLFPEAFIQNLAAPSNYIGPGQVFGSRIRGKSDPDLVKVVHDYVEDEKAKMGWMPQKHDKYHIPLYKGNDELPHSLKRAVYCFLIACVVRKLRGQGNKHSSMLIHVTRLNDVQARVAKQVQMFVHRLSQRLERNIDNEELINELHHFYESEFLPDAASIGDDFPDQCYDAIPDWNDILLTLPNVVADVDVRTINGSAKDALDYEDAKVKGLKVIAIGGDKLSRGLTLEGLCTSYFLRASKMYDTLMQMGRWFGYRDGYLDVCRIFTTSELIEWFGHIADASDELREEFDLMISTGGTPSDFGLKVQSHSVLLVTSRVKMRSARELNLSFSGQLVQTIIFPKDQKKLSFNLSTGKKLLSDLAAPGPLIMPDHNGKQTEGYGHLWTKVSASKVSDFFRSYQTHPDAYRVVGAVIAEFVEKMASSGELTHWDVALIGNAKEGKLQSILPNISVRMLKRTASDGFETKYPIGTLISPRDLTVGLSTLGWEESLKLSQDAWRADPGRGRRKERPEYPSGPAIRQVRGYGRGEYMATPEKGLLLLYLINPEVSGFRKEHSADPILAWAASFPGSSKGVKVNYKVNPLFWEQEYGTTV